MEILHQKQQICLQTLKHAHVYFYSAFSTVFQLGSAISLRIRTLQSVWHGRINFGQGQPDN